MQPVKSKNNDHYDQRWQSQPEIALKKTSLKKNGVGFFKVTVGLHIAAQQKEKINSGAGVKQDIKRR